MIRLYVRIAIASRRIAPPYIFAMLWISILVASPDGDGKIGQLLLMYCIAPIGIGFVVMTADNGLLGEIVDASAGYLMSISARVVAALVLTGPMLAIGVFISAQSGPFAGRRAALDSALAFVGCATGAVGVTALAHPNVPGGTGVKFLGVLLGLLGLLFFRPFQVLLSTADGPALGSSWLAVAVGTALAMGCTVLASLLARRA